MDDSPHKLLYVFVNPNWHLIDSHYYSSSLKKNYKKKIVKSFLDIIESSVYVN